MIKEIRKWRPSYKCLYVIPEINGAYQEIFHIFDKIIPLRKIKNQEDTLVMLGNYITNDEKSHLIIDKLIDIKNNNKNSFFLLGKHELNLLKSLNGDKDAYIDFLNSGGDKTLQGYFTLKNVKINPFSLNPIRLNDLIPKNHIEFYQSLLYYKIIDEYCFFHGGFNYLKSIEDTNLDTFIYDTATSQYVKEYSLHTKMSPIDSDYVFVSSYNHKSKEPYICQQYIMLGGNAPKYLYILDLLSMSCSAIKSGKKNMYKYNFKM